MIAALIGAVWAPGVAQDRAMPTRDVLLIHGPIHYDLLIPLDDISRPRFAALEARGVPLSHPDARWLVIGWGARKFYTQTPTYRELKPGNVWRGVIGDDAVLRIDVIGPINQQIKRRSVAMTERQYRTLVDNVWSEFTLGPDGLPERVGVTGYTTTDGFFAAEGRLASCAPVMSGSATSCVRRACVLGVGRRCLFRSACPINFTKAITADVGRSAGSLSGKMKPVPVNWPLESLAAS